MDIKPPEDHTFTDVGSGIDRTDVTLAVLAGGAGTRMGFPKQHLQITGKPILEYLARRFAWPGPTLLVTTPGREHPLGAEQFDVEAVDAIAKQGPLRGVLTALENAGTYWVVIVTVDMPGLEKAQLHWLIDRLKARAEWVGLMLERNIEGKTQIEPFPFVCRREIAPRIADRLSKGRRSVQSLADLQGFAVELAPQDWPASSWTNLNLPEDYETFVKSLK